MSEIDPKTVREIAQQVADIALHDSVHVDQWITAVILSELSENDPKARLEYYNAVARRLAVVKPSWPDEQQPADVVTAEQQQDGAATEAAGRVTAFCEALDHYGDDGNPIASEQNPDGDPDTVLYLTLTKQDLRAVLAERTALAARVAELEGEREADARAALALLIEDEVDLPAHWAAVRAIRDRFADRIAALDADTDGGAA